MRYKQFKNANVKVSALAVGTWAIGGNGYGDVDTKDSVDAIRAMLQGGVNLIDTAPAYGYGHSEKVVAKAIEGLDRSKFMLSTKCSVGKTTLKHFMLPQNDGTLRDSSFANVMYECECSLNRMKTDYIDFYFIHWPDYSTPLYETAAALNLLKEQGKIRYIGLSNFSKDMMEAFGKYCQIDVIQPAYSMVVRRDEDLMKWSVAQGIDTFTYGSLGAGILTGAFRQVPEFGPGDPRNGFYPFFKEPQFSKVMKVLDVLDAISAETGKPLAQIAINWSTQKDYVSTALCGVRNVKEAEENCETFNWTLTDEQIARIDAAIAANLDFDGSAPIK